MYPLPIHSYCWVQDWNTPGKGDRVFRQLRRQSTYWEVHRQTPREHTELNTDSNLSLGSNPSTGAVRHQHYFLLPAIIYFSIYI